MVIAASGRPLQLLKTEFPNVETIDFPDYNIQYPAKGSMAVAMLKQLPKIWMGIRKEQQQLKKIIVKHRIDAVISDNRFGLYSKTIPCVFITHQLMVKCSPSIRFLEPILQKLNQSFIRRYNTCWVPDFKGVQNLSGDLSHKYPLLGNVQFIGPLSRLAEASLGNSSEQYDILGIISGPEPQRSIIENKLLQQFKHSGLNTVLACGRTEDQTHYQDDNVTIVPYADAKQLRHLIQSSNVILCRSGYSTLMDLQKLGKKAILIPTPGQTEQEYLAQYYQELGWHYSVAQNDLDINEAMALLSNCSGWPAFEEMNLLQPAVNALLEQLA